MAEAFSVAMPEAIRILCRVFYLFAHPLGISGDRMFGDRYCRSIIGLMDTHNPQQ